MVTCKFRKLYDHTTTILNDSIAYGDKCEVHFNDTLPDIFCGKGLNDIRIFSRDQIFASYMFTIDVHTRNIGSYLYMNTDISEEDAYHVLYGFMLDYFVLSSTREDIKSDYLIFKIEDMKGMSLIPIDKIDKIKSSSSDLYHERVDEFLKRI